MFQVNFNHTQLLVAYLLGIVVFMPYQVKADKPTRELLWPAGAPGAKGDAPSDKPTLTYYVPPSDQATGTAMVICPSGGTNTLQSNAPVTTSAYG